MKFRFLKAENFLSLGDVKLKLANRGVVLIMGENRDASGASSNGAGKSAIWDAMVWGLFGKTLRGITGDDVVNLKAKKNCKVRLSLKDDAGQDVKIIRYRKHK
ncbi:MAG: AAA family ATPase, partial [Desulfobacterales bacterium]|nr:AAA family ATPase [Desulfobacterales bacterium]